MRDATIKALDNLATTDPPLAVAILDHRAEVTTRIERGWAHGNPLVATERAVLLLFDVLAGITIGTLRHDQGTWMAVRYPLPDSDSDAVAAHCGTFRCVAGWLAHFAQPNARPVYDPFVIHYDSGVESREVAALELDGRRVTIREVAVGALLDRPPFGGVAPDDIVYMFAASNTLADLWDYAGIVTGGAITVPFVLVEQVEATRDECCAVDA